MAAVDPLYAQWLQGEKLWATRPDVTMAGRWGKSAVTSERETGMATRAGAQAQADIDLAFFGRGPFAIDVHQLAGDDWHRELGRTVRLTVDQLGYEDGADVFVLGAEVDRATGLSEVTVLKPLGAAA